MNLEARPVGRAFSVRCDRKALICRGSDKKSQFAQLTSVSTRRDVASFFEELVAVLTRLKLAPIER